MTRSLLDNETQTCCLVEALGDDGQRPVVVAVPGVGVVQVTLDQVVGVVAVRHRLVAAVGAVLVARVVTAAVVLGRAVVRVLRVDRDDVLVHVVLVRVMQVAAVQVVGVALVLDGRVAAARAVLVRVVAVGLVIGHESSVPPGPAIAKQVIPRGVLDKTPTASGIMRQRFRPSRTS
jgi:hypothetical protein